MNVNGGMSDRRQPRVLCELGVWLVPNEVATISIEYWIFNVGPFFPSASALTLGWSDYVDQGRPGLGALGEQGVGRSVSVSGE